MIYSNACLISRSFYYFYFINMNPMKLINMDESLKGTVFLLNDSRMLLVLF